MKECPTSAVLLRDLDRFTWLSSLLMPGAVRNISTILWALHSELAAIADKVKEPIAGEIRLQWWIDVLNGEREGEARANPLSKEVMDALAEHSLSASTLAQKAEAHIADLYADPPADRTAFECYAGETRSVLYQMTALSIYGDEAATFATASGHAGVVMLVRDVLVNLDRHLRAGRCHVPADILAACGLNVETVFQANPEQRSAIQSALAAYGEEHLLKFRDALRQIDGSASLLYLPVANVSRVFKSAPNTQLARVANGLGSQFALWSISRSGRF